jgi:hypothetical protein
MDFFDEEQEKKDNKKLGKKALQGLNKKKKIK